MDIILTEEEKSIIVDILRKQTKENEIKFSNEQEILWRLIDKVAVQGTLKAVTNDLEDLPF